MAHTSRQRPVAARLVASDKLLLLGGCQLQLTGWTPQPGSLGRGERGGNVRQHLGAFESRPGVRQLARLHIQGAMGAVANEPIDVGPNRRVTTRKQQ
jgi:hypothetical protein